MIKFNLNPNEQIVLIARKHWIAIIGRVIFLLLIILVPLILLVILPLLVPNFPGWMIGNLVYLYTLIYSILLMVAWVTFFFAWTEYRLDIWVVTTHRIFIVEQVSMFYREVSSLTLDKIQDLTIDVPGFIATMLKFGDIHLETAGEHKNFKFPNAKNPEEIKIAINSIQKDFYSRPLPVSHVGADTAESADANVGSTAAVVGAPNAPQNIGN